MAENMDHAVKCASMIAYLEGVLKLSIPKTAHDLTLSNLEKRITAIELNLGIESPPPFEISTWNGMVWRVWRARARNPFNGFSRTNTNLENWYGMAEGPISIQDLDRVIESCREKLPALKCAQCEVEEHLDSNAETLCLDALVQKLCYIAAVRKQPFPSHSWTRDAVLTYAASLSCLPRFDPRRPRTDPPPSWGAANNPAPQAGTPVRGISVQTSKVSKGARNPKRGIFSSFFGIKPKSSSSWWGKLLFWRRKRSMYSGSSSSSSVETID